MRRSKTHLPQAGFTIVELLIVIVVIAILAAVSVVAYTGIQQQARDAQRRSDLGNIAKTLSLYAIEHDGDMLGVGSGCGANGEGSGWWHSDEERYPKSTRQCLVDAGYTHMEELNDPSGCTGGGPSAPLCVGKPRYMIMHCDEGGDVSVFVLGQLETEPKDGSLAEGLCVDGLVHGFPAGAEPWVANYGINYVLRVR